MTFAGGLGQVGFGSSHVTSSNGGVGGGGSGTSSSSSSITGSSFFSEPSMLSAPARNSSKRGRNNLTSAAGSSSTTLMGGLGVANVSSGSGRKTGHHTSSAGRVSPVPISGEALQTAADARSGRRQLPAGRSGPAFRQAIQEEDEDEEE